jgi:leucyl-tRNA synthetase
MTEFGAQAAFRRTLPFSEMTILSEILPYLKRTLNLVDVDVLSVEDARSKEGSGYTGMIIDSAEPGNPAFEYRNV